MKARDNLLQVILDWAKARPDIEAVILTGSLARDDGRIDDLSDIDIELIGSGFTVLQDNDEWLTQIAPMTMVLKLGPSPSQRWATRLAIYKSGIKVDYTLAGVERVQDMCETGRLDEVYARGYRVLIDKSGIATNLHVLTGNPGAVTLPTQETFQDAVEIFWFEASHVPKYLARGDLWPAKLRDQTLKKYCLKMMMWHAAVMGYQPDIWHNGHRMADWLDPDLYNQAFSIFGGFDVPSSLAAFQAQMDLFRQMAHQVAEKTGLIYPQQVDDEIMAMIGKISSEINA